MHFQLVQGMCLATLRNPRLPYCFLFLNALFLLHSLSLFADYVGVFVAVCVLRCLLSVSFSRCASPFAKVPRLICLQLGMYSKHRVCTRVYTCFSLYVQIFVQSVCTQ